MEILRTRPSRRLEPGSGQWFDPGHLGLQAGDVRIQIEERSKKDRTRIEAETKDDYRKVRRGLEQG